MNDTLPWKEHVNYLSLKIARGSWAILKIKSYVNNKTLRTLYYSLILPIFSIASHLGKELLHLLSDLCEPPKKEF